MAKVVTIEHAETVTGRGVEKECPKCHSTMFQGPVLRGRIVDGKFTPVEELFSCVGCHTPLAVSEMQDRVSPAFSQ